MKHKMMPNNLMLALAETKRNRVVSEVLSFEVQKYRGNYQTSKENKNEVIYFCLLLTARHNYRKREKQSGLTNLTTAFRRVDLNIRSCLRN